MSFIFHLLVPRGDVCHGRLLLVSSRRSLSFRGLGSGLQIGRRLRESYGLLQLPDDGLSSAAQVKEAYLRLAKLYHPDSGAPTADALLFARVEEAYRTVLAHQSKTKQPDRGSEVEDGEAEGTAVAHRHYLSYEGVGSEMGVGDAPVAFGNYRSDTLRTLYESKDPGRVSYVDWLLRNKSNCTPGSRMEAVVKYILQRDPQRASASARARRPGPRRRKWSRSRRANRSRY